MVLFMQMLFHKKERTPLGFCDGLDNIFVGFGSKDERGCRPPKYHTRYAPYYRIHKAASTGDIETVRNFVERGVFAMERVDWKHRTALHFASVYGHPDVVTLLVDSKCEISPKDIKGATPLIKAAQCRQMECLDTLLSYGADPNIMDCCGNTALHYAVYNGDIGIAARLLEFKANIEAMNENKITPLLLALKQNKEKMAEFLISRGANAETCDFLGRNSLMYAVRCGSEHIIKLLLQGDIDTFKKDAFGWTAKRYAIESKSKVRKLLIDYDEEKELRQRCSEATRKVACSMPILPTTEVKDSPQSEAAEKAEERPSKSGSPEEDACTTPILPTTEVKDSPQSEAVEKAEERLCESENAEKEACSMPTAEMEDALQHVAVEKADARPSNSEPVSSEEKTKKCEQNENKWSLKPIERVFQNGHSSEAQEEKDEDITKGRVLAWVEDDHYSLKPTTTEKKSSDEVEIITLKQLKSDLSVEVVIEVSSEEEKKGDDDDDDDDSIDDGDGDGITHQQHLEEETRQPVEESNEEGNPSDKTSIFQKVEDSNEDAEVVATEQLLEKDEEPKSQKNEDSNKITEEEATKQPLGKSNQGSPHKMSPSQTVEDSAEDPEEEAEKQPAEKNNQESHYQKTNNDKNLSQKFEDSSKDSEDEATKQPEGKSNKGSPCKKSILQKLEDSRDNAESIFECLSTKGSDHLHRAADGPGEEHNKESPTKYPLIKPTIEMNDLDPKNALGMEAVQTLTSANSDSEVTSTEKEKSHSDSTINLPLTIFKYLPQKEKNGYLTGNAHLQGQNTAIGQMKEPVTEVTSRDEEERDDSSEKTQAFSISETYGPKKILAYLQRVPDQRTQNVVSGGMIEVKKMASTEEQRTYESSASDNSWTFSDPLPHKADVNHLTRSRDQRGKNMAREELKALCKEVTSTEEQGRHDIQKSVPSPQIMSEPHPPKKAVVHFAGIPCQERENIASMEMKVASIDVTSAEEHNRDCSFESAESLLMSKCLLQKKDVSHLSGTAGQGRNNITSGEIKGSAKEYPPQLKPGESLPEYTAVVSKQESTSESETDNEEISVEELTSLESYKSIHSWTTSETFSQEDIVVHLPRTTEERPKNTTKVEMKVPDKEMISTEQRHDSHGNVHALTTSETPTYMGNVVCVSATTGQIQENMVNAGTRAKPDKEVTSTQSRQTRHYNGERKLGKEDEHHFAVSIEQGSENVTHAEAGDLCKEVTLTEEQRRRDIHGGVQSLIVSEPFPQKDVTHVAMATDHRTENKATSEVKAKPDIGVRTSTKVQEGQESNERLGTLAISESLPWRHNVDHLASSEHQRKKNVTDGEKEATKKGVTLAENAGWRSKNEKAPTLIFSALSSTKENLDHLPDTVDQRRVHNTSLEMNEPGREGTARVEQREHGGQGTVQPLIFCEHPAKKHDVSNLAVTTNPRRQNKNTREMKGPREKETATEDERKYDTHESVQPLIISEPVSQKDGIYLPKITNQREEKVANGQMKEEPNLLATSREKQNKDAGNDNSQPLLKRKRKMRLSNKADTAEKPSYGNTTAAAAGGVAGVGGAGGDAGVGGATGAGAVAIADPRVRKGPVLQIHCRKAHKQQFPVPPRKHIGLNKKTSDEKYKAPVEHTDAVDDHQLSESLSEDYELSDYDNILMIVDQLRMNYKDSGRLLEMQDAVPSYKMILERNQTHSESPVEQSKDMKNQASKVLKKPQETRKVKAQLRRKTEEPQLDLLDAGLAGKQEAQQRNSHYLYEKIKKQLTEKEEKYEKEKQQLETHLIAQDMELRRLRDDMNKLQEAQHREAETEDSDRMTREHLQKVEHDVFNLIETIGKQTETIEQLEKKLPSEDKNLAKTGNLTQAGQEFFNNFRENYITSVMSQMELRIQHLESEISEMKIQTCNDAMVLENYIKLHQSHKLRETEAKLKEVTALYVMLIQHSASLLNMLRSVLASACPCSANLHRTSGNLFAQENVATPTSGPQSPNHCIATSLGVAAGDDEDFNKALTKLVLSLQSELDQTKKKYTELVKEKTPSKKCFKLTKISTVSDNGQLSLSEGLDTAQFEMDIPTDVQHELRRENGETFDNIPGNQNASYISTWEFSFRNLQPKQPEEIAYQESYKGEPSQYEALCLERVEKIHSSSHKQLKSKERQDEARREPFEKVEANRSAPIMHTVSPAAGITAPESLYDNRGHKAQREPLVPSLRPQPLAECVENFQNRVRKESHDTLDDIIGNHNASHIRPQESTHTNLQPKHPAESTQQASYEVETEKYEDDYLENIKMMSSLAYEQLRSQNQQDKAIRKSFEKMEACSPAPSKCTASPELGFAAGHSSNSSGPRGNFIQREAVMVPNLRPWRFVESLDCYLCRTWQELCNDHH